MKSCLFIVLLFLMFLMIQPVMADITTGLVAQYHFNGNANDTSGNGHDGVVSGAALTSDRFGNPNSAYSFDGVDDYISVSYSSDFQLSTYTVSAWIRPSTDLSLTDYSAIVTRGENTTSDLAAHYLGVAPASSSLANGVYTFYEDNGDNDYYFDTGYYPPAGAWTHISAIRSSSDDLEIYINGNLSNHWSSTAQPTTNSFQDLIIGAYWYRVSPGNEQLVNFFPGSIDEVMIYDRALSTEEIRKVAVIPAPSAIILGSLGVGLISWLRRQRMM